MMLALLMQTAMAQAPLQFNYQAVLRDDAGQPMASEAVTLEVTILQGSPEGTEVFSETHQAQTNTFGLINISVGSVSTMEGIEWAEDDFFMRISANGTPMGTAPLLSVPYALHAHTTADAFSGDYHDLENTPDLDDLVLVEEPQPGDLIYYAEGVWHTIPMGSEGQVLKIVGGSPAWAYSGPEWGTVSDIDGNVYQTKIIGMQEWMAENLRTTQYRDGTSILTGLSANEWANATEGAYSVFPHDGIEGIDSEAQMVDLYGKFYNWFAVDDERGLCPDGWRVPTDNDWQELEDFLLDQYDAINPDNLGNALKSCRQVGSPLGGECDTENHPRWNAHGTHYGTDDADFSGLPAGSRNYLGNHFNLGNMSFWWTSSTYPDNPQNVIYRRMFNNQGVLNHNNTQKQAGFSVRCIKE